MVNPNYPAVSNSVASSFAGQFSPLVFSSLAGNTALEWRNGAGPWQPGSTLTATTPVTQIDYVGYAGSFQGNPDPNSTIFATQFYLPQGLSLGGASISGGTGTFTFSGFPANVNLPEPASMAILGMGVFVASWVTPIGAAA